MVHPFFAEIGLNPILRLKALFTIKLWARIGVGIRQHPVKLPDTIGLIVLHPLIFIKLLSDDEEALAKKESKRSVLQVDLVEALSQPESATEEPEQSADTV